MGSFDVEVPKERNIVTTQINKAVINSNKTKIEKSQEQQYT